MFGKFKKYINVPFPYSDEIFDDYDSNYEKYENDLLIQEWEIKEQSYSDLYFKEMEKMETKRCSVCNQINIVPEIKFQDTKLTQNFEF
jgi:hypothetical protein